MGSHLRIGFRGELDAFGCQLAAQLGEILDDPVVHDRDPAIRRKVRVSVDVVGSTMCRPPGMPNALVRLPQWMRGKLIDQASQFAGLLGLLQVRTADQGDTGRIIAAVLHTTQSVDDDLLGILGPGIADNSAHAAESTDPYRYAGPMANKGRPS